MSSDTHKKFDLRKMSDAPWYWTSKGVLKYSPLIKATGLAIYNMLASMVDKNQYCYPSQGYIAEQLQCSRTTVNKYVRILQRTKLIAVEKDVNNKCRYYLLRV